MLFCLCLLISFFPTHTKVISFLVGSVALCSLCLVWSCDGVAACLFAVGWPYLLLCLLSFLRLLLALGAFLLVSPHPIFPYTHKMHQLPFRQCCSLFSLFCLVLWWCCCMLARCGVALSSLLAKLPSAATCLNALLLLSPHLLLPTHTKVISFLVGSVAFCSPCLVWSCDVVPACLFAVGWPYHLCLLSFLQLLLA